jgi:hypothetical protein
MDIGTIPVAASVRPIRLILYGITNKTEAMTIDARKLQSALIETGKDVEGNINKGTPSISELKVLFDKFSASSDTAALAKTVAELIAGLVKWQVEKM